tara:strand:- start:12 stop:455 length:444 start_codon:yes stop_codon:yes gene_type:complete
MNKLLLITIIFLSNNNFAAYIEEDLLLDCSVIYERIYKYKNKIVKEESSKFNTSAFVEIKESIPSLPIHTMAKLEVSGVKLNGFFVQGCDVSDSKISCKSKDSNYVSSMDIYRNSGIINFNFKMYGKNNVSLEDKVNGNCGKVSKKF